MQTHNLKIDAHPFSDLLSGAKTGEVRNDDRGFEVGDNVHLTCIDGRTMDRTISHIQRGYGLPDGICVLSYTRADAPIDGLETVRYEIIETLPSGSTRWKCVEREHHARSVAQMLEHPTVVNALVHRSQAEAIIAAERSRADKAEADAEKYREYAAEKSNQVATLQKDNTALTARVKEQQEEIASLANSLDGSEHCRKALETQLAAAEKISFEHGYVLACCNVVNLHDEPTIAHDTLSELGVTRPSVKAMNLSEYDLKALRKIERGGRGSPYGKTPRKARAALEDRP